MSDFLDLKGASGRSYRFRLDDGPTPSPMGGNYCFVRREGRSASPIVLGVAASLATARDGWAAARERGATHLYTRLNVARGARAAEHDDMVAALSSSVMTEARDEVV